MAVVYFLPLSYAFVSGPMQSLATGLLAKLFSQVFAWVSFALPARLQRYPGSLTSYEPCLRICSLQNGGTASSTRRQRKP